MILILFYDITKCENLHLVIIIVAAAKDEKLFL